MKACCHMKACDTLPHEGVLLQRKIATSTQAGLTVVLLQCNMATSTQAGLTVVEIKTIRTQVLAF